METCGSKHGSPSGGSSSWLPVSISHWCSSWSLTSPLLDLPWHISWTTYFSLWFFFNIHLTNIYWIPDLSPAFTQIILYWGPLHSSPFLSTVLHPDPLICLSRKPRRLANSSFSFTAYVQLAVRPSSLKSSDFASSLHSPAYSPAKHSWLLICSSSSSFSILQPEWFSKQSTKHVPPLHPRALLSSRGSPDSSAEPLSASSYLQPSTVQEK